MLQASAFGSLIFWSPMLMCRILFGAEWGPVLMIFPLTVLVPILACLALEAFTERWKWPRGGFAGAMIFGIWASGPLWITLINTASAGEGFHMPGAWSFVAVMTATFPLTTIMMATYQGSLGALYLTTIALLVFSLGHWSFLTLVRRCLFCRYLLSH